MKIKSYFAATVEDAIAMARSELGPEAMLINSRRTAPEAQMLGDYEVVFASDASVEERDLGGTGTSGPALGDRLTAEVAELKQELESMRRALARSACAPSQWVGAPPSMAEAFAALTANDVAPDLAREIVHGAAARAAGRRPSHSRTPHELDDAGFQQAVVEEIESRVMVEPFVGRGEARPRIAALVGPPGGGKTATLVKLVVNYGLASRRPALLISMDAYRVAATEQLRSYAAILGVGFQALETVSSLSQAIEENRGKDLILIDTPGFGFGDMDHSAAVARFLAGRNDVDVQLVLPCSMKSADLSRVANAFEGFRPRRLLFTKLDETASFGPILNEAARTGKPLSFFGSGQRIPDDIEAATRGKVAELVLRGMSRRALSAA